jgi:hypothetical protein
MIENFDNFSDSIFEAKKTFYVTNALTDAFMKKYKETVIEKFRDSDTFDSIEDIAHLLAESALYYQKNYNDSIINEYKGSPHYEDILEVVTKLNLIFGAKLEGYTPEQRLEIEGEFIGPCDNTGNRAVVLICVNFGNFMIGMAEKSINFPFDPSRETEQMILEEIFNLGAESSVVHEMQHCYDWLRGGGRLEHDKKTLKYHIAKHAEMEMKELSQKYPMFFRPPTVEQRKKLFDRYLKLNPEINSRFNQLISRSGIKFEEYEKFGDLVDAIQDKMEFNQLTKEKLSGKDFSRIMTRLYVHWDEERNIPDNLIIKPNRKKDI